MIRGFQQGLTCCSYLLTSSLVLWNFDQVFGLISSFLSRPHWVVLDGKSSQEYLVNVGVPQGSILGLTLSLMYSNDLPHDIICNIAIYDDDTTLYSKCDQASHLWQQLKLATERKSDLQDTGLAQEVACWFQC